MGDKRHRCANNIKLYVRDKDVSNMRRRRNSEVVGFVLSGVEPKGYIATQSRK